MQKQENGVNQYMTPTTPGTLQTKDIRQKSLCDGHMRWNEHGQKKPYHFSEQLAKRKGKKKEPQTYDKLLID